MEYQISTMNQSGPYSLEQLRLMWEHGTLAANSYYFEDARSEWLPIRGLVESGRGLFAAEEAFVRLGQARLKGCLRIHNKEEIMHVYVDDGFVVAASGDQQEGEFALARALHLEDSSYAWFLNTEPSAKTLRLNIVEYAMKHSMARDVRIGGPGKQKQNTETLGTAVRDKAAPKTKYILVSTEDPSLKLTLTKLTNVVGREPQCDVVVDNNKVSRKHCLLEIGEQNLKIKDLDSSNGTHINGVAVKDGVLKVGDQLGLGSYKMILHREEEKRAAPVPA